MKKARLIATGISLLMAGGAIATAVPATADTGTVTTVPMSVDCSKTTPEQIAAGHAQGWDFCGGGTSATNPVQTGAVPRSSVAGNCGTASIYTDRKSKGKGRISWSLFSTKGAMLHRDLAVTWGPAGAGTFNDISFMNSEDYSKSKTVLGSGKLGATMHGFVVVGSFQVSCTIPSVHASSVNI